MTDYPNVPLGTAIGGLFKGYIPNITDPSEAHRYQEAIGLLANPAFPVPARLTNTANTTYSYATGPTGLPGPTGLDLNTAYGYLLPAGNETEDYLDTSLPMQATLVPMFFDMVFTLQGPPESAVDNSEGRITRVVNTVSSADILSRVYVDWSNVSPDQYTFFMENSFNAYYTGYSLGYTSPYNYYYYYYGPTQILSTTRVKMAGVKYPMWWQISRSYRTGPPYSDWGDIRRYGRTSLVRFDTRTTTLPVAAVDYNGTPNPETKLLSDCILKGVSVDGSSMPIDAAGAEIVRGFPSGPVPIRYPTFVGSPGFKIRQNQICRGWTAWGNTYYSGGNVYKYNTVVRADPVIMFTGQDIQSASGYSGSAYTNQYLGIQGYVARLTTSDAGASYPKGEFGVQMQLHRGFIVQKTKSLKRKIHCRQYVTAYAQNPCGYYYYSWDYYCTGAHTESAFIDTVAQSGIKGLDQGCAADFLISLLRVGNQYYMVFTVNTMTLSLDNSDYCTPDPNSGYFWGNDGTICGFTVNSNYCNCTNYIQAANAAAAVPLWLSYYAYGNNNAFGQLYSGVTMTPVTDTSSTVLSMGSTTSFAKTIMPGINVNFTLTIDANGRITLFDLGFASGLPTTDYLYAGMA